MASTLTWSAFVDQNQVVWELASVNIVKLVEEEKIISINIINRSGQDETFTITNIPAWMSVSPSSGNLSPLEAKEVEIRIHPDLNVGRYHRDLNLVSSMGYNEKIDINVKVNGIIPDWTVNPENLQILLQLSDSLVLEMYYQRIPKTLLVFLSGISVGVLPMSSISKILMFIYALLVLIQTWKLNKCYFKVYDASTGDIFTNVSPSINFVSNAIYGSFDNPIPINATNYVQQSFDINSGWNWLSFNVFAPEFNNLDLVLTDLQTTQNDIFKSQTEFANYSQSLTWVGSLNNIDVAASYKLKSQTAQNFKVSGYRVIADTVQIPINAGWNWIGYPLPVQQPLMSALSSLNPQNNDIIKSQHQFAVYSSVQGWVGSLTYMRPGRGYMMYSANDGILNYSSAVGNRNLSPETDNFNIVGSETNMTIIAEVLIDNPNKFTVKAYDKNGLCGKSEAFVMENSQTLFFITINSSAPNTVYFVIESSEIKAEANETLNYTSNKMLGSIESPFQLSIKTTMVNNSQFLDVYPNPFTEDIYLNFNLKNDQLVNMRLVNSLGSEVSSKSLYLTKGIHQLSIMEQMSLDKSIAKGVYMLRITINGQEENIKIIKQ